jgi:hypothetical protein
MLSIDKWLEIGKNLVRKGINSLRGLLSLPHSAVPFDQGESIAPRPKKPFPTPSQACESASGSFSPLSRLSLLVGIPWVKQRILFLSSLCDAHALHLLNEAQLAALFDDSDLAKGS